MEMTVLAPSERMTSHRITVHICRLAHAPEQFPVYATPGSAGMDIRAALEEPLLLQSLDRALVPTGFILMIPAGYECQIRARSGLSIKHGLTLINCVGTIDSDYRDEVKVPVVNLSNEPFTIQPGERIAQMIFAPVIQGEWLEVVPEEVTASKVQLGATGGRQGGFGSTGRQ